MSTNYLATLKLAPGSAPNQSTFRSRIDAMINLEDPLAVLAQRMPWAQIEAALAPKFEHGDRQREVIEGQDLVGRRSFVSNQEARCDAMAEIQLHYWASSYNYFIDRTGLTLVLIWKPRLQHIKHLTDSSSGRIVGFRSVGDLPFSGVEFLTSTQCGWNSVLATDFAVNCWIGR